MSAARGAGFCGRGDRKAFCVLVLHRLPTCWPIVVTRVEISVGCGRAPWCRPTLARIMSPGWLPNRARWCPRQESNLRSRLRTPESYPLDHRGNAVGRRGLEPRTCRLRVGGSTIELATRWGCGGCRIRTCATLSRRLPFSGRLPYRTRPILHIRQRFPVAEGARIERAPGRDPGPRISNPVPCQLGQPSTQLPVQGSNLAGRIQNPACCLLHQPGKCSAVSAPART